MDKLARMIDAAGPVIHAYNDIQDGRVLGRDTIKVREQPLKLLIEGAKRDILVLRPKASVKDRLKAIQRARSMSGWKYSKIDLFRAGLFPGLSSKEDFLEANGVICSGMLANAYNGFDFRPGSSRKVVRPSDIHDTPGVSEVVSYSADGKTEEQKADATRKVASIETGVDSRKETPKAATWEELKSYLQPGDIILTKASQEKKNEDSGFRKILSSGSLYRFVARKLNRGSRWSHAALYTGDEEDISRLSAVKSASIEDIFMRSRSTRPKSETITRSAIVRPNLAKGIETRESLGIDKDRSNSNKANSRNKNLIDIFS